VTSCKRFGQLGPLVSDKNDSHINVQRPRLLLVTLSSETEATAVLHSARLLKSVIDQVVCKQVFINKDQTKDEAKVAFEKQSARRNKPPINFNRRENTLSASALPFIPLISTIVNTSNPHSISLSNKDAVPVTVGIINASGLPPSFSTSASDESCRPALMPVFTGRPGSEFVEI